MGSDQIMADEVPRATFATAAPGDGAGAPDWATQADEICCPMCEYNLRGLTEPRCPECGYRFEWRALLAARSSLHPYLYEHHPEHRVKSFWRTAWGTLSPGSFWRSLQPAHRLERDRLVRYWIRAAGWLFLSLLLASGLNRPLFVISRAPMPVDRFWWVAWGFVGWVLLTYLSLQIFQASMRSAKVRSGHVLRGIVYSSDFVVWAGVVFLVIIVLPIFEDTLMGGAMAATLWKMLGLANWDQWGIGLLVVSIVLFAWRLCRAYQLYLRFDRPFATVLSTQAIVLLTYLVLLAWVSGLDPWGRGGSWLYRLLGL